ncbi:sodium:proton antiporter [Prevotella sp. P5-126]|uniref:sodium:proton antiporter NhaD n=1 Tax=Prevotella sp. P5-126 TaxID=2024216 RepID=UPI000B96FB44|nr:sodium:proton antiporter NhaD [Prevotella sp. P5-126]MBS7319483.1 sodium:proton antiporter NhaD [Prevotella sp.]MDD7172918.1 sodium:proton antiporter NhaD [Prevotella sp.]MDY4684729.1 sodium:proton antiporter NhaD [Prevotella sp.]OYP36237.1 sodium:proton antiporter [Prevotella sp. P5-126]
MSTITMFIIVAFVAGYLCITLESLTKINKAAIALLMCVVCWTLLMVSPGAYYPDVASDGVLHHISEVIEHHLGDAAGTLFFLMGAMTIVEIVDSNGGFNFVRDIMKTRSKRKLLWRVAIATFFLSSILDNLTTSIVMIMVLRKLVQSREERLIYAALIIISANSGGAFSPIGDVTTIMLWIKGVVTTQGILTEIFIPSLVSMLVPAFILQYSLSGKFDKEQNLVTAEISQFTKVQRNIIFWLGVGGLVFVPIFKSITHLPPFMGILLVLGVLWTVTEIFHHNTSEDDTMAKRVSDLLSRIDLSTIMFFLGILMAVAVLQEIGVLTALGTGLNEVFVGNYYVINGIIGVLSSIVDNVPLVAGCMGMYPVAETGAMAIDGIFWQLLAYCAGVGGSMLIIGSAAGVVVMGLEKITFGWYLKRITWIAFVGYLAGIVTYWLQQALLA